jgi:hypothetical protein
MNYFDIDDSTHIHYPDKIEVKEQKAPTDDSIRLLNEFQEKALDNIIAKVKVDNNIVKGEIFLIKNFMAFNYKIIVKFKINGNEFVVEKEVDNYKFEKDTGKVLTCSLEEEAKHVILYFCLKILAKDLFEHTWGNELPDYAVKQFIKQ